MFSFIGGVNLLFIDLQHSTNKLEFDVCDKKSPDWVKTPEEPGLSFVTMWVTLGRAVIGASAQFIFHWPIIFIIFTLNLNIDIDSMQS